MPKIPVLSDIPAVNRRYEPGDCLLVRVTTPLTSAQVQKVERAVVKFAGAAVSVAVVNTVTTQILLVRSNEKESLLLTPVATMTNESKIGMANLDLAKVPFQDGDRLHIRTRNTDKKRVWEFFNHWVRHTGVVEIYVEVVV